MVLFLCVCFLEYLRTGAPCSSSLLHAGYGWALRDCGGAQHRGGGHEVPGTRAMAAGHGGAVQTFMACAGEVIHPQQEASRLEPLTPLLTQKNMRFIPEHICFIEQQTFHIKHVWRSCCQSGFVSWRESRKNNDRCRCRTGRQNWIRTPKLKGEPSYSTPVIQSKLIWTRKINF